MIIYTIHFTADLFTENIKKVKKHICQKSDKLTTI